MVCLYEGLSNHTGSEAMHNVSAHQLPLYHQPPGVPTTVAQLARAVEYKSSGYDTKQSDGEVPVMLELWGMLSTPSLPSPPDPLWPGVVVPDRV